MGGELGGYVDVYDFNTEISIPEVGQERETTGESRESLVEEEIGGCRSQDKGIEKVGHSRKGGHHEDGEGDGNMHQSPSEGFEMPPEIHFLILLLSFSAHFFLCKLIFRIFRHCQHR